MDVWLIFWYLVCPLVGFVFIITAPWLLPLLWFKLLPKTARTFFWAARRNQVPALIVHDSGRGIIALIQERRGEGVVVTNKGNYRLLPRYPKGAPVSNPAAKGKVKKALDYTSDWVLKRCILVGLGLPFYVGYSGSLCLLNPECLAWYEAGKVFVPTPDKPVPTTEAEKTLPKPLMLLDGREVKGIINRCFDTTQISAALEDMKLIGLLGRGFARFLLPIGIIVIILVAVLALLTIGPQMQQQMAVIPNWLL